MARQTHGGTKCVWALEREEIAEFLCHVHNPDAWAWLAMVTKSLKHENEGVVVRLWVIWHTRRKTIHENQFQGPFSTHSFTEQLINKLEMVRPGNKEKQTAGGPTSLRIKPPWGYVKIDVDTATSKDSGQASVAAVARD